MNTIGIIGVGTMGGPMASRLLRAGYKVHAMDIRQTALEKLVKEGAISSNSTADIANSAQVIIFSLPDSRAVESVVYPPGNLLQTVCPGTIIIDMGTSDPTSTRQIATDLAAKSVQMLDAPISGGETGAKEGTLSCMVGGTEETYLEVKPILGVLASTITHVGGIGMGHTMKLLNNMVGVTNLMILCEVFSIAANVGINLEVVRRVLEGGSAQSKALDFWGEQIIKQQYQNPTYRYDLAAKDMRLAMALAIHSGTPIPVFSATNLLFTIGTSLGFKNQDVSILKKVWGKLAEM